MLTVLFWTVSKKSHKMLQTEMYFVYRTKTLSQHPALLVPLCRRLPQRCTQTPIFQLITREEVKASWLMQENKQEKACRRGGSEN